MSVWIWVLVGLSAWLVISVLVCIAIAAALGAIGSAVSELLEVEPWADAPNAREREAREAAPTACDGQQASATSGPRAARRRALRAVGDSTPPD